MGMYQQPWFVHRAPNAASNFGKEAKWPLIVPGSVLRPHVSALALDDPRSHHPRPMDAEESARQGRPSLKACCRLKRA
ncbi:hypothetical protein FQN50_004723 [Emmonsiellopsis sp. PD_5]|nr:hypothetical protein FQN50_004723 [Emmonsiellopsis sp. PD_5]